MSADDWQDEPMGPDDRTIRTSQGTVAEPASWLAFVHRELREPDGFVTVSSGPPHLYAQACNQAGTILLEYRDGAPDRHFQAEGLELADVAAALEEWFEGERGFIEQHTWRPLAH